MKVKCCWLLRWLPLLLLLPGLGCSLLVLILSSFNKVELFSTLFSSFHSFPFGMSPTFYAVVVVVVVLLSSFAVSSLWLWQFVDSFPGNKMGMSDDDRNGFRVYLTGMASVRPSVRLNVGFSPMLGSILLAYTRKRHCHWQTVHKQETT